MGVNEKPKTTITVKTPDGLETRIDDETGTWRVTVGTPIMRAGEYFGWVATALAVVGVLLNNGRLWPCFLFWIASNGISAYIHKRTGLMSLMVRDLIFLGLAFIGLWQWTR